MVEGDHTATATTPLASGGDKPPPDEDELLKTVVGGRYEILRRIGTGGMGVVYAGRDTQLGRAVAIKLVASRTDSSVAQDRLFREARAMAKLRHPNVVTVHDVGTLGERTFIIMELVEGGTLAEWLKAKARPWREVVQVFLQAARGLAAAHAAGIVHRDFKPENVLFGKDGLVRVSDFGVVRLTGDAEPVTGERESTPASHTMTGGGIVGTPGYIAPEIIGGDAGDARADQFSYSVALHRGLYGRPPFTRAGDADKIRETLGEPVPAPSGMAPGWLQRIVARGLSAKPQDRWPSIADLAAAIERGLRRRRRVAIVAAAALVVVGSAGAVVALRRPTPVGPDWVPAMMGPQSSDTLDVGISRSGAVVAYLKESEIVVEPREGGERRHVKLPPGDGSIARVALSRNGETVFVRRNEKNGQHSMWALDGSGRGRPAERLLPSDFAPDVVLSGALFDVGPNGRPLVVLDLPDRPQGRVAWIDAAGAHPVLDAAPGGSFNKPSSSPDGTRVSAWGLLANSSPVTILDIATQKVSMVPVADANRGCEWLSGSSLICLSVRADRTALVEVGVSPSLEVSPARERYVLGPYQLVTALHGTEAGVFFATWSLGARLQSLDLEHPGALRTIGSDSVTDLWVAGWMSNGSMIFGANMRGRLQIMSRDATGRVDVVRSDANAEVPLVVLGDSIVFGRFANGERSIPRIDDLYRRVYPVDGELFRLDPGKPPAALGPTHGLVALRCAGDRAPPCVLIEHEGDQVRAIDWNPTTSARGREVAHWTFQEQSYEALAPDGHTLAHVVFTKTRGAGDIDLVNLQDGSVRRVAHPGYMFRHLSWEPDGTLVATAYFGSGYAVARLRDGAPPELLFTSTSILPFEPRIRPDGKELVLPVNDTQVMYWWVAR